MYGIIENKVSSGDFKFRKEYSTVQQRHRKDIQPFNYIDLGTINKIFETKQYCSAAFLRLSQAFDKV